MIVVNVVLREKKERRKGKIEEDSKNQSINPMSSKISFFLLGWCLYIKIRKKKTTTRNKKSADFLVTRFCVIGDITISGLRELVDC